MSGLLSLQDITAGYAGHEVVKGASLSVEAGEFCALLGLNGCGKTTLLRAACGLLPLQGGRCTVQQQITAVYQCRFALPQSQQIRDLRTERQILPRKE